MRKLALIPLVAALAACSARKTVVKPSVAMPTTTTVTVTEWRDVPGWATEPVLVEPRRNDSVVEHLRHEHALERAVKLMNCHRRLLRRLNAGETPERKECER